MWRTLAALRNTDLKLSWCKGANKEEMDTLNKHLRDDINGDLALLNRDFGIKLVSLLASFDSSDRNFVMMLLLMALVIVFSLIL